MAYYGQQPQGYGGIPPNIVAWFQAVDADRSGQISGVELQQALTNQDWSRFSLPTCYKMIGMFDRDYSGTINLQEFNQLMGYINQWQQVFARYDRDGSKYISTQEFQTALQQMGYGLSPQFSRTATWCHDKRGVMGQLDLESFICCCLKLQRLTGEFQRRDAQRVGRADLSYEDFMLMAVNNIM